MPTIFRLRTGEGYIIKILTELLQNNIKVGCFAVDEDTFSFRMMDHHRRVLIDFVLQSENFSQYTFEAKEKLYLGINLQHLHRMLKSVKKKDTLELVVDSETPDNLCIMIIPKDNNRTTVSNIKIQDIQTAEIDLPEGYTKPIIISSSEYQKMCKDMNSISKTIKISSTKKYIKFNADMSGIYARDIYFGEMKDDEEEVVSYEQRFDTDQLLRISKVSGLNPNIQVYTYPELPILFKTNVGTLGRLSVYIKSREQEEKENQIET